LNVQDLLLLKLCFRTVMRFRFILFTKIQWVINEWMIPSLWFMALNFARIWILDIPFF
jgi:hypothetical protein